MNILEVPLIVRNSEIFCKLIHLKPKIKFVEETLNNKMNFYLKSPN